MAGGADGSNPQNQIIVHQKEPSTSSLTVPKLTSTNYNTWTVMMEAVLDAQDLWEAVDPDNKDEADVKKNKIARAMIYQSLHESILAQVTKTRSAREIWEARRIRYLGVERVQQAKLQSLQTEFDQLKMGPKDSVDAFGGKMSELINKFENLGQPLDTKAVVKKLLNAMPTRYIGIVATIEQVTDLATITFEDCLSRLKAFGERIKGNEEVLDKDNKLMYATSDSSDKKKDGVQPNPSRRQSSSYRGRGRGNSRGRGRGHGLGRGRC